MPRPSHGRLGALQGAGRRLLCADQDAERMFGGSGEKPTLNMIE